MNPVRSTPKGYHYRISENLRRAEISLESAQRFLQVRNKLSRGFEPQSNRTTSPWRWPLTRVPIRQTVPTSDACEPGGDLERELIGSLGQSHMHGGDLMQVVGYPVAFPTVDELAINLQRVGGFVAQSQVSCFVVEKGVGNSRR